MIIIRTDVRNSLLFIGWVRWASAMPTLALTWGWSAVSITIIVWRGLVIGPQGLWNRECNKIQSCDKIIVNLHYWIYIQKLLSWILQFTQMSDLFGTENQLKAHHSDTLIKFNYFISNMLYQMVSDADINWISNFQWKYYYDDEKKDVR